MVRAFGSFFDAAPRSYFIVEFYLLLYSTSFTNILLCKMTLGLDKMAMA
jgi:hypothetical protein